MDDAFGHWLAGFIDGEGCFSVREYKNRRALGLEFCIALRDDDGDVLREIHARIGIGTLRHSNLDGWREKCPGAKPQLRWVVSNQADCLALVCLLERYPLRAKKARDFALWAQAAHAWLRADWTTMASLKSALQAGKAYDAATALTDAPRAQLAMEAV